MAGTAREGTGIASACNCIGVGIARTGTDAGTIVVEVAIVGIAGEAVIAGSATGEADGGIAGQALVGHAISVVGGPAGRHA